MSGQVGMPGSLNLLDLCCQKIASKFSPISIEEWKNGDYVKLSSELRKVTKVYISPNTLKRLFGKLKTHERYYPQKATRDALAVFLGFRDWREFETVHQVSQTFSSEDIDIQESTVKDRKRVSRQSILLIFGVFILGMGLFIYWNSSAPLPSTELYSLNQQGRSPHSVVFKLKGLNDNKTSLNDYRIIFRDWKNSSAVFHDSTLSHYYEMPGVYYPSLLYKNKVIDSKRVILQTDGWEITAQIQGDTTRVYPIRVSKIKPIEDFPNLDYYQVFDEGIDTLRTFFLNYANIRETSISGDNMFLEANLTTSKERPGVRCSQVDITIFGENDRHSFSMMKPECTSWCRYKFSEKSKSGKSGDLRALGHDLTNGGNVQIRIVNKLVSVIIEGNIVFEISYEKPIGNILGVNFMFAGIGKFSDFSLQGL